MKLIIKIIILTLLFLTNTVEARSNITNDAYVLSSDPNANREGIDTALLVGAWFTGEARTYIDLGFTTTETTILTFYVYDETPGCFGYIITYNTTSFNESIITWNNAPGLLEEITRSPVSGCYPLGWNNISIPQGIRYITINTGQPGQAIAMYSAEATNGKNPYINQISLSGTVYFTDINGTTNTLSGASVFIDSIHHAISDSVGHYIITLPLGTYTVEVNKSLAFSNTTTNITISGDTIQDFTLLYSKGQLSTPTTVSGRILTQYSHNFYPISLWRNPDFVWAVKRYDAYVGTSNDKQFYTAATYDGGNQFSINKETGKGNYQLYFASSDFFNNPTTGWHPTVSETRYFNSSTIYIQITDIGSNTTHTSIVQKETAAKNNFWKIAPYAFIILLIMAMLSKIKEAKRRR